MQGNGKIIITVVIILDRGKQAIIWQRSKKVDVSYCLVLVWVSLMEFII